jgi:hypothetical protein
MPTNPSPKPTIRKKNRQRNQMLITGGVLAVLALAVGIAFLSSTSAPPPPAAAKVPPGPLPTVAKPSKPAEQPPASPQLVGHQLVDDDGRTLWASPTDGDSISLEYLPPGCDLVLHLRPAAWLGAPAGLGSLEALGPQGARLVGQLESATGYSLAEIDELLVGVRGVSGKPLEVAMVVSPRTPLAISEERIVPPAPFRAAREAEFEGSGYRVGSPWCFFAPLVEKGQRFVVATRPVLHEVLESGGAAPPLRRELEAVAAASDRQRHATLIVAPSFLFTDGRTLFSGVTEALRDPVFEFQSDAIRAASLSAHWGDSFYLEALAASAAEVTATRMAAQLDSRIGQWPSELQLAVLDLNPAPHGRRLVAQLPAMARLLAEHTRFGAEDGLAVLNCYLPEPAGENLLAASELMLAQLSAGAGGTAPTTVTAAPQAVTIAEKLQQKANVSFARDTLEMAVAYLSEEIEAPILILGGDLQLEGITKNQSFGLDAIDQPAGQILLVILQRANPDKTAAGPTDPKQKLVYVVKPGEGLEEAGRETIYVTTRAAAAQRGDKLPSVFQEE